MVFVLQQHLDQNDQDIEPVSTLGIAWNPHGYPRSAQEFGLGGIRFLIIGRSARRAELRSRVTSGHEKIPARHFFDSETKKERLLYRQIPQA